MRRTFRSLGTHNFRLWFFPGLVSNVGAWMQATAVSWVVLTELTPGDAVAVGVTMALQLAPQIVLVPITGLIADRIDRRKLLIASSIALTLLTICIGLLLASGLAELWHFLLFALVFGLITAIDQPARNTIVSDLVPERDIPNAVALNLANHHAARLVGPATAGVIIATLGSGWVFVLNAVTFLPLIAGLALMRKRELVPVVRAARQRGDALAGFRYIGRRPDLGVLLGMIFLLGIIGMNFQLFAATMAVEFGAGPSEFGLLTSVMATGSLLGALLSAGRERARLRVVLIAGAAMGTLCLLAAFMPTFWTFAFVTVFIGLAGVTTFTTANGYAQVATQPALRGRVMSIHMAVLAAGTPVGAPLIGWITNEFGARWALGSAFLLSVAACVVGLGWYGLRRRRRDNEPPATRPGTTGVTEPLPRPEGTA
ncbi:MFS transporter [Lysobacter korlensis]|uniref:MFS transporter n=1 Tax=Lysobacter korlensis TaxID=553636 RepID=A0ABV6RWB8_9GAMM